MDLTQPSRAPAQSLPGSPRRTSARPATSLGAFPRAALPPRPPQGAVRTFRGLQCSGCLQCT
eukprot:9539745-Alexandrium_andersonii.AAC.1